MQKSQNENILAHLKQGNRITALEALNRFGCFRLASRISDLKKQGLNIDSQMIHWEGKKFKEYWLKSA